MYHPSTRLLTILELLQARGRMSGLDLAKRLEVSPRSIRRYIAMLQDMGIPIEGERGRYGQYRLRPGYKLPPLMFDDEEVLAVTAGLLLVQRSGGLVESATAERALAKLDRVLPTPLRDQVTALQETLVLEVRPTSSSPVSYRLRVVTQGVQRHQRLWLKYLGLQGGVSERELDPYGVAQHSGFWYTVGYCHLRQALRAFRLDRIEAVQLLDITFEPPTHFDVLSYIQESFAHIPAAFSAEVLLKTTLDEARRATYPNLVTLEPTAAGIMMRCTTDNLSWLARVVAGFEFAWEVQTPAELTNALEAHAATILKQLGRLGS